MRIVFLAGLLFALYSCNNDLNTIGDTMVPAEGYVNIETFEIFCIFLSYFYAIHLTKTYLSKANWIKPDISYHVNHGLTY